MNSVQKKVLITFLSLVILASCSKKVPEAQVNSGTTDTSAAEDQLLNDINEVINSLDNSGTVENTGAQVTPSTQSGTTSSATDKKVVKLNQQYTTPGGNDEVEFSLTFNGDVVDTISVKTIVGGDITKKMHASFEGGINQELKGKTLADVEGLSAVGGASLTTKAFIAAVKSM